MDGMDEDGAQRRSLGAPRGARREPASVKALVRIAKRVLRSEEWGSVEFRSGIDGNSVRVHRAPDLVPAASPKPRVSPPATAAVEEPRKLSRKQLKVLKYRRHGCLTQHFTTRFLRFAMRSAWARWREHVVAKRAATAIPASAAAAADDEMKDEGTAAPSSAPTKSAPRTIDPGKRPASSPPKAKKRGKKT